MAQAITEEEEAVEVAQEMYSTRFDSLEHESSYGERHQFRYDGVVHAHRIRDGWQIIGFGSSWFAIRKE